MAKPRCANCDTEMISAHTRSGLHILICPNTKARSVKRKSGLVKQTEIYCNLEINGLRHSFEQLTEGTDITIEKLREATHETVSDADLYENVNLAIMLGVPKNLLVKLVEAMYKLSLSIGLEPSRGIHSGCKGVGRGRRSRLLLDNIGITFKPSDAYEWFQKEYDLDKLTTERKTTAWQHYGIHQIMKKASELE